MGRCCFCSCVAFKHWDENSNSLYPRVPGLGWRSVCVCVFVCGRPNQKWVGTRGPISSAAPFILRVVFPSRFNHSLLLLLFIQFNKIPTKTTSTPPRQRLAVYIYHPTCLALVKWRSNGSVSIGILSSNVPTIIRLWVWWPWVTFALPVFFFSSHLHFLANLGRLQLVTFSTSSLLTSFLLFCFLFPILPPVYLSFLTAPVVSCIVALVLQKCYLNHNMLHHNHLILNSPHTKY